MASLSGLYALWLLCFNLSTDKVLFRFLSNNSLTGTIPATWSKLNLETLLLDNNNFSQFDVASLPTSVNVLTLSCQNQTINDTHRCDIPPGLNISSLLLLNRKLKRLSVIDVQNTTSIFNRTRIWTDWSYRLHDVEQWGAVILCAFLFLVFVCGVIVEVLHARGQLRVSPRAWLGYLDYRANVRKSSVVGCFVFVAFFTTIFFVVVEVWTFRYASQRETINTVPFEENDMTDRLNFTFHLEINGSRARLEVNDSWYTTKRNYLGFDTPPTYHASSFSAPVGWDVNGSQLQRAVDFSFTLGDAGGFAWSLGATAGKPPSEDIMLPAAWYAPALRGAFTGVRHYGAIAASIRVDNIRGTYDMSGIAGYQVPNRRQADGSGLFSCVELVDISVLATPFNVSVIGDPPSGTKPQRYQTYLFTEAVQPQVISRASDSCGETTVRMTMIRKDFMVNHHVSRIQSTVSLLTKLLGLVGGVSKTVMFATRVWFFLLKRWRAKKFKGTENAPDLIVLKADDSETGSWEAQSAWNRNSSERIEKAEARIEKTEARHMHSEARIEKSEALIAEWKARVEKLEELLRVNAL